MSAAAARPKKLVLAVIDALDPSALEQAVRDGGAPTLARLMEEGTYVDDCVSTFPSVTPVAASAIATGLGPADHLIPSMNWYHRGEERYVEYGSSFGATRAHGIFRSLQDTVYNMNLAHLTQERRTVFEHLDDAGLRTACTTYLIYRGRFRHEPSGDSRYRRLAEAAQFRHAVWGARELFYADLFDSQNTGCSSTLGMPGQRDRHAGCVGAHLVENDLFDFLLFSLPDNDTYSHKLGPEAQPVSIAEADRALERLMDAAGGPDEFLAGHAVVVMSDHSQNLIEGSTNLAAALEGWRILGPVDTDPDEAELAVCPAARSAQVYVLDRDRVAQTVPRLAEQLAELEGVDLVITRSGDGGDGGEVAGERGRLTFRPGGPYRDERGLQWSVEGDLACLDLTDRDGTLCSGDYPDPLRRLWSALRCPRTGDVLLSAQPGHEFTDWGGQDHVGGGSHGSLHRCDSLGVLLAAGVELPEQAGGWSIEDVTPLILEHFGVREAVAA
jgi:type I phosphodiesterase/nucleotide pyrophosphatase